jgi:hypothetical protein
MNILDYKIENPFDGEIINKFIDDYIKVYNCKNILFVRTPTTGEWLDKLCINNTNVIRILYDTKNKTGISNYNLKSIIKYEDFEYELKKLNKKFDLICIDPFHEYETSKRDFKLLYSLLTANGTIISHDCFPETKLLANPKYQKGAWCGETYVALVDFAYNNAILYYGLLNIDTGIGIISKSNIAFLTNNLNFKKQEIFLSMHKNNNSSVYEYFCENSIELINAITL